METTKPQNSITEGVIWKQILLFFLPVAFGTFFQQMYNTADTLIVGRCLDMDALAAVGGITAHIITLIVNFIVALTSGVAVVISQYYGAKNGDSVSHSVHTGIALSVLIGAVFTLLGIYLVPHTLRFLNQPEALIPDSVRYIQIYFIGMFPTVFYNMGASVIRAIGDSRRPMIYLIVCCITNIVLDYYFIAVLHMGVDGAAWATVVAQFISAVLVYIRLRTVRDCYKLSPFRIRFHKAELRQMLIIGLPAGFQSLMYSVTNTFIQARINLYGKEAVAAWTVLGKVDGITWLILSALGVAVTTFVSQNYGAGKIKRVYRSIHVSLLMGAVIVAGCSILMWVFGADLFRLFKAEGEVLDYGLKMLYLIAPFYVLFVPIEIFSGGMRGVGDVTIPTIITGIGICAFRVSMISVMYHFSHDLKWIVLSYGFSWIISSLAFFLYYKFGHWLKLPKDN